MEAAKGFRQLHWLSMLENVGDVYKVDPIRQFCPARVEEEKFQLIKWEEDHDPHPLVDARFHDDVELGNELGMSRSFLLSPASQNHQDDPFLATGSDHEVEGIVDAFFDSECFDKDNRNHMQLMVPDQDHCFQDMYDYFPMAPTDIFGGSGEADDVPNFLPDDVDDNDEVDSSDVLLRSSSSPSDNGCLINRSGGCVPGQMQEVSHGELVDHDQGLQIVHLLLGCAEAMGCRDAQLADSILTQISPFLSPWGDSLQRVSYYFAMALKSRLTLLQNQITGISTSSSSSMMMVSSEEPKNDMEAIHLLHQSTPFFSFGFTAANEAICQATQGKDVLHILDLGSRCHHLQWPPLIRNLASRHEGPPKLVHITSILENHETFNDELHRGMLAVIEEASSVGIPVQFHYINRHLTPLLLTKEKLNLREGEVLIVNCIMHLHKFMKQSGGSLKAILQAIKRLGPTILTVVEQDANHNGPFFLGRFLESLHYYSAIFDSLEARFPRASEQRMKIETYLYAKEIQNIVASEGFDRIERHQRMDQWRRQLGRAGFQVAGFQSMSQARMMLSVYDSDGYTLDIDKGCLLLGWKGRPIMLASAWKVAASQV